MTRGGPASRTAVDPAVLCDFVEAWSEYRNGGHPRRTRLYVNGVRIAEHDARMLRRWRAGNIKGVTVRSAGALLRRYGMTLKQLDIYAKQTERSTTTRGALPQKETT